MPILVDKDGDGVVVIDGKTSRRLYDRASEKKAIHLISAWAVENRFVLAQIVDEVAGIQLLSAQLDSSVLGIAAVTPDDHYLA